MRLVSGSAEATEWPQPSSFACATGLVPWYGWLHCGSLGKRGYKGFVSHVLNIRVVPYGPVSAALGAGMSKGDGVHGNCAITFIFPWPEKLFGRFQWWMAPASIGKSGALCQSYAMGWWHRGPDLPWLRVESLHILYLLLYPWVSVVPCGKGDVLSCGRVEWHAICQISQVPSDSVWNRSSAQDPKSMPLSLPQPFLTPHLALAS